MDLAYRDELRELNDRNFARFDAKLEQRLAEVKSDLRAEMADLRGEMHSGFASLRGEMHSGLASLRAELASMRADIIKWMFLFWAGTALTVIGLLRF